MNYYCYRYSKFTGKVNRKLTVKLLYMYSTTICKNVKMTADNITCSITELREETSDFYVKTRDISDHQRDEVSLSYNDLNILQLIAKTNQSRY